MICGIDEVGRGAWAGPMVVGAVVLGNASIEGLTDSKKLTKRRRERLAIEIQQKAAGIGLGWVSARTIDRIGLGPALKLAARRAVTNLSADYDEIIIDGTIQLVEGPAVTMLPKADLLIPAVSAASIVAKVARDTYMALLEGRFEGYGLASHVGYGTAAHLAAIERHGVLPIHRRSFAPIQKFVDTLASSESARRAHERMAIDQTVGRRAEIVAAEYLRELGHDIIDQNWKTRRCEIDIVSQLEGSLYFTEVKYRSQQWHGGGLAAISKKKLEQMTYASDTYVAATHAQRLERRLSVITLTGEPPHVETYIASV